MIAALVIGALVLTWKTTIPSVGIAQFLIGGARAFLGPTVAAITLGIVGKAAFDRQFGRNQGFNAAGNVFTALLLAGVSYELGTRWIFVAAALLAAPTLLCLRLIDGKRIDYARSRGAETAANTASPLSDLSKDRILLLFLICAFLFHLANAARVGRDAVEWPCKNRSSVYVRVHHRNPTGDYCIRRLGGQKSDHLGTQDATPCWLRSPANSRAVVHADSYYNRADWYSNTRWCRQLDLWHRFDSCDSGSHAWHGAIQSPAGSARQG